jgi:uncharacterized protein (TIGR00730 family)
MRVMIKRICVFCGSNPGARAAYAEAAVSLAKHLVDRDFSIVYGGSKSGLMGTLADTALNAGGEVIGVIPQSLVEKEVAHRGLTRLHVVATMHERKALMAELAGGFIALPGGYGTFDELCEILTWAQLGIHNKPCGLLNVEGYFDKLLSFFDHAVAEQLLKPAHRRIVISDNRPESLLNRMLEAHPPQEEKWIDLAQV